MMDPSPKIDIESLGEGQLRKLALHLGAVIEAGTAANNMFLLHLSKEQARALNELREIAEQIEPLGASLPDAARAEIKAWAETLADAVLRNAEGVLTGCNGWTEALNALMEASGAEVRGICQFVEGRRKKAKRSPTTRATGKGARRVH